MNISKTCAPLGLLTLIACGTAPADTPTVATAEQSIIHREVLWGAYTEMPDGEAACREFNLEDLSCLESVEALCDRAEQDARDRVSLWRLELSKRCAEDQAYGTFRQDLDRLIPREGRCATGYEKGDFRLHAYLRFPTPPRLEYVCFLLCEDCHLEEGDIDMWDDYRAQLRALEWEHIPAR